MIGDYLKEMKHINRFGFVGGVHGVGKSTICQGICRELKLQYLSASKLIQWDELNDDPQNKSVKDIRDTQARLISAINRYRNTNEKYLLDGHFCLFNYNFQITRVSFETFEKIAPSIILVITGNAEEIVKSQMERGGQVYGSEIIAEMQICEVDHARQVANNLGVPFIQTERSHFTLVISELQKALNL
jgi:adenylate kinase